MNAKKVLALLLCLLLAAGVAGNAAASDVRIMEGLGEAMMSTLVKLIGDGSEAAEAATWLDLRLAAAQGKTEIAVTADITRGEGEDTIVFKTPITLRAAGGQQFTIDGGGRQILCVQGDDSTVPLEGMTTVIGLRFINGNAAAEYADAYGTGSGGALFVLGDVRAINCVFSGNTANYGAAVCADGSLTLDNCTVENNVSLSAGGIYALNGSVMLSGGVVTGNLSQQYGGGVYAHNGSVTVVGTIIKNNTAEYGGGVFAQYGSVDIWSGAELSDNIAGVSGSAVYAEQGAVTMTGGLIAGNTAPYGAVYIGSGPGSFTGGAIRDNTGEYGGALNANTADILLGGELTMTGNTAEVSGGCLYAQDCTVTVEGGELSGNTALYGGCMYLDASSVTMSGGELMQNDAEYGGAFYLTDGDAVIKGGLLRGNTAVTSGGAIYADAGDVIIEGGRIRGNTAAYGGGVLAAGGNIYVYAGLIFGNDAQRGGALYAISGDVNVYGGRVTANTASDAGGGIYLESGTETDERGAVFGNTPDDIAQP